MKSVISLNKLKFLLHRCQDMIKVFPHLKELLVTDTTISESDICLENINEFLSNETSNNIIKSEIIKDSNHLKALNHTTAIRSFNIENNKSIFSSDKIMALQLFYNKIKFDYRVFKLSIKYRFLDKCEISFRRKYEKVFNVL